ncbi:MAG: glutamate--tRNA ligase [Clostridia bacterium]|nr:glutamate--tRNA ligase [Clostridia bacterium]
MSKQLAELLFPKVTLTPKDMEQKYPVRQLPQGAQVTRFAPSPTGFLHIGGVYTALVSLITAKSSDGILYLRIEDTDKKRQVDEGIKKIIDGLAAFDIDFDEGAISETESKGNYGPYIQSQRREIYHIYAKELVEKDLAYPCFCTPEELEQIREKQIQVKANPGYYGEWSNCRNLNFEEIKENIENGKPYVLRLKSQGDENKKITFNDKIKGKIELPENVADIVLLKNDGVPTYHFAHAVDDYLMRTTVVIRGDEWLSSLPTHFQLFSYCGFKFPKYAHISPIMKEEDGSKRKLSKRRDPEASVDFYLESGYPVESVIEYLYRIINSNFEQWRQTTKEDRSKFKFSFNKMSKSGALFDLQKLNEVSKNLIANMTTKETVKSIIEWSEKYDREFFEVLNKDLDYTYKIFAIDREKKNPRKDMTKWSDAKNYSAYFFDEYYTEKFFLPENIQKADAIYMLKKYIDIYDINDENSEWFNKIKTLCDEENYTSSVKEYKKNPGKFKGHVGDISTLIRIAVTGRENTPDLCTVMKILGEDKVKSRIHSMIDFLRG